MPISSNPCTNSFQSKEKRRKRGWKIIGVPAEESSSIMPVSAGASDWRWIMVEFEEVLLVSPIQKRKVWLKRSSRHGSRLASVFVRLFSAVNRTDRARSQCDCVLVSVARLSCDRRLKSSLVNARTRSEPCPVATEFENGNSSD